MVKHKFKVGEKVIVRADFTPEDAHDAGYVKSMEDYRGKIYTVKLTNAYNKDRDYNGYKFEEDKACWWFNEKQLMPAFIQEDKLFQLLIDGKITDNEYEKHLKFIT